MISWYYCTQGSHGHSVAVRRTQWKAHAASHFATMQCKRAQSHNNSNTLFVCGKPHVTRDAIPVASCRSSAGPPPRERASVRACIPQATRARHDRATERTTVHGFPATPCARQTHPASHGSVAEPTASPYFNVHRASNCGRAGYRLCVCDGPRDTTDGPHRSSSCHSLRSLLPA